jgi:hypothetical protein
VPAVVLFGAPSRSSPRYVGRQEPSKVDAENQIMLTVGESTRDVDLIVLGCALRGPGDRAGMTQEQLAAHLQTDPTYVSLVERGHRGAQWFTVNGHARSSYKS